jgi:hypothetical protein
MKLEPPHKGRYRRRVPLPAPEMLTAEQTERLFRAMDRIERDRLAFAKLVRRLGVSACARALHITPQAMSSRIRLIEGKARITAR